jgi:putative ABC transport system permease protein
MKAGDVRQIKEKIETSFGQLLMMASTVALAAMAVASLGVTNTIMASVRSRRWQFGVLRSVGVTRSQLLRLVLAEAGLLGIVGAALGLACGLDVAVSANRLAANVIGYNPPLDVPWGIVGLGAGLVVSVSLLASVWPAVSVARSDPLGLMQAGRSAG